LIFYSAFINLLYLFINLTYIFITNLKLITKVESNDQSSMIVFICGILITWVLMNEKSKYIIKLKLYQESISW